VTNRVARLLRDAAQNPAAVAAKVRLRARLARLRLANRMSARPAVGDGRAVVSLTSHGHRVDSVFYALESIAAGSVRPGRLMLWIDEADTLANLPRTLRRLQARGLEILSCPNYGPHKKQYPYARTAADCRLPLVTADDDVLYPRRWLAILLAAVQQHPDEISGMRTRTVTFDADAIAPYDRWKRGVGTAASYRTVATGVSGVVYPPEFLAALRDEGERFMQLAPHADDIWVHAVAVRHGFRGRQVGQHQAEYPAIPGTQVGTLYRRNVTNGGNDAQIAASYGEAEIQRLRWDDPSDSGALPGAARASRGTEAEGWNPDGA
jgi:hypothetical protein